MKNKMKKTGGKYAKPKKKTTKRQWIRRGLLCFALVCAVMTIYRAIEDMKGEKSYDSAAQIAFQQEAAPEAAPAQTQPQPTQPEKKQRWVPAPVEEEDEHYASLQEINLEALKEVNPDVIGWILIPETKVNYPILRGQDNEFYLRHTWEKVRNGMGSIFLEHRNRPDFYDFNTILYGHNMNSGDMFGELSRFATKSFQDKGKYVYIVNADGVFRYEVFSYYQANITDSHVYGLSFKQTKTKEAFIAGALEHATHDKGVVPAVTDRILTLSTCSTGGSQTRWVVQARLPMILVEE